MPQHFLRSIDLDPQPWQADVLSSGLEGETTVPGEALSQINGSPPSPPPPRLQALSRPARGQGAPIPPYPIVRHVSGTRTIVRAHLQGQAINAEAIGWTLRRTQYGVEGVMHTIGDGWLPAKQEPYTEDFQYGCYISMWSNSLPGDGGRKQHLTWGIMNSTLEGLLNIAYVQGYSYEMKFDVVDSGWGRVSEGYIKAGSIYAAGLREGDGRANERSNM
ncbi:MAG: hypothetical protein Q9199_001404 [Rusavskia elegans]